MSDSPHGSFPVRKNVAAWRIYNHRHWQLETDILTADERAPFVCESTSANCVDAVALTMVEFEAAPMCPTWCAVRPGHTGPRHERRWVRLRAISVDAAFLSGRDNIAVRLHRGYVGHAATAARPSSDAEEWVVPEPVATTGRATPRTAARPSGQETPPPFVARASSCAEPTSSSRGE